MNGGGQLHEGLVHTNGLCLDGSRFYCAGDAISAYMIIRAFSWQLRLSPVAFEEFAAALFASHPSPLIDEARATTSCPDSLPLHGAG